MILEIARITVKPGMEEAFEAGVDKAASVFQRASGCEALSLRRCTEVPSDYLLMVNWKTLEDHTVYFRQSEGFTEWRECVAHCFAKPPVVDHHALISQYF